MGKILLIFLYILSCSQTDSISFTKIPAMDSPPSKREYALLAYNNQTDSLIVFGGNLDVSIVYNDVWSFSLESKTWSNLVPLSQISPSICYTVPRIFFGGFVDSLKNKLYVFGGLTINGPLNDMWSYDLDSLQWNSVKQKGDIPSSRYRFAYTSYYDIADQRLKFALYGGCLPIGTDNNLFIFDVANSTWTLQKFQKIVTPKLDFPVIEHLNGFIYMCGGIEKENKIPFNQKFFRYNIQNSLWENITNSENTYISTYYAGSAIIGTNFYLLYGWSEEFYGDIEHIMTVDLSDPEFKWKYANPVTADNVSYPIIRDSLSFASKPGSFYMFGGYSAPLGLILNNMIEYTLNGDELEYTFISPEYLNPSVRERHSLNAIYEKLYLFGGSNQTLLLNDFWAFYPEKNTWEPVFVLGNNPPPRSGHGSDSKGDILVIFGGEGYEGYTNDLYVYNVLSNQWTAVITSSSELPTPRKGSCIKIFFPYIFIFGGLALAGYSNELWVFDISTYTYNLVYDGTGEGPLPTAFSSCKIEIDDNENILFFTFYGTGNGEAPLGDVDYFNFTSNKWTNVYTTNSETPLTNRANAVVEKVSDKIIVMGGDLWAIDVYKDIFILDLKEKSFTPLGFLPDYIYRAAYVYFKNNIYIHGGGSMYGHSMRILVGKNSFMKVDFEESLDLECSPGFFEDNGECQLCKPGTYADFYGMSSCIPCPEGTYNPSYGSNSYSQCYPCPENTFSNELGSINCKKCPVGKFCLTGSIKPLDKNNYEDKESIQPDLYNSGSLISASASSTILNLYLSFGVFLFILISIKKLRKEIAKIDIYDEMHNYVNNSVMVLRRTKIGGAFTSIFIAIAFLFASYEIGSYINTNVEEMKHFIPLTTLWDQISTFSANITVSIVVYGYGDSCGSDKTCSSLIEFLFQYITYQSIEIYCIKNNEGSCIINVIFTNSELSYGSHLELTFKEKFSYASAFKVNVTSTSSIPDKVSSMYQALSANKTTVFRGPSPSQFYFSLIPSYFMSEISDWPSELTGYHVSIVDAPIEGSEVSIISLPFSAGLKINVWLDKRENCLLTDRSQKVSINVLMSVLIGSIFGIASGAGGVMRKVELVYDVARRKVKSKKKSKNLKQKRENFRNMLNSNIMENVSFEEKNDVIYIENISLESFNY